jgi:hypothetical protein
MTDKILSDKEVETLILSFFYSRGKNCATEQECVKLIDWAERVRIEQALLDGVMEGLFIIDMHGNGEPTFKHSPKGEKRVKELVKYKATIRKEKGGEG